jgi:hypothetical protein
VPPAIFCSTRISPMNGTLASVLAPALVFLDTGRPISGARGCGHMFADIEDAVNKLSLHSWIDFDVKDAGDQPRAWALDATSRAERIGVTRDDIPTDFRRPSSFASSVIW